MKKLLSTAATAAAIGGLGAALAFVGAGSALAFDAGSFSAIGTSSNISDTSGTNLDVVAVQVSGPCDAAATRHVLKVTSVVPKSAGDKAEADKWAGDNLYAPIGAGLPGPLSVSASNFWQGLADTFGQKLVAGKYNLELRCQNNLGTTIYEQWKGSVTFSSPTAWSADALSSPSPSPSPTSPSSTPTATTSPSPSSSPTASPSPRPSASPSSSPTASSSPSASATASPSPTASGSVTVTRDGGVLEQGDTLEPGDELEVEATGFTEGEDVTVTLASTPALLATLTADGSGVVLYSFVVPKDIESGDHTLTLLGADSGAEQVFAFAIDESSTGGSGGGVLAQTGAEVGVLALIALSLVAAGVVFVVAARRRTRLH